ncbi:sigma 54-interacting transcriptional regulator [Aquabacterium sp. A7-Y]|uniref:sigma 54-interacting transcriptional regulator n=1 Tax=Aquabacterium sp. A7-Y TaxID=1349605 RepID=UPI00223D3C3F|nr:sigma 54-interacting transcriptional regulator [Aquabacterium sp. A7-Y]MCW7541911.1 sigma 54-interacting transcriptional regulator [Aquabacterium sp. A7-Y]
MFTDQPASPPHLKLGPTTALPDWTALNLIGRSRRFRGVLDLLLQYAAVDATVLLCGETGTGKELAARALHYLSRRRDGPFVPVNCGAIPDSLLEAELFGHVRGAFTDAKREGDGVITQADKGTLFLDEVNSLSPRAQVAILRFVQDRSYRPVGAPRLRHADVRLIAASNADLETLSRDGLFRQDLLFRLNLLTLSLPPLREREGDALLLAQAFMQRFAQAYGIPGRRLDAESIAALQSPQPWPGNVRELEHRVHRCFLLSQGPFVNLGLASRPPSGEPVPRQSWFGLPFAQAKAQVIADFERYYLSELLAQANGNLSLAARLAGKERSRFGKLVKKYGLLRAAFSDTD